MSTKKIRSIFGLPNNGRQIKQVDYDSAYLSNQYALTGGSGLKSPEFGNVDANVFLEFVLADAAWTLKDKDGNTVFSGVPTTFGDFAHAPIRMDGGFELTGANFGLVKGFLLIG